mgnify:CR=1 FL=1
MPEIDRRISLGNLLTIAAVLVPARLAWGSMRAEATIHAAMLSDHATRLRAMETRISDALGRIDTRLSQIEKELSK